MFVQFKRWLLQNHFVEYQMHLFKISLLYIIFLFEEENKLPIQLEVSLMSIFGYFLNLRYESR